MPVLPGSHVPPECCKDRIAVLEDIFIGKRLVPREVAGGKARPADDRTPAVEKNRVSLAGQGLVQEGFVDHVDRHVAPDHPCAMRCPDCLGRGHDKPVAGQVHVRIRPVHTGSLFRSLEPGPLAGIETGRRHVLPRVHAQDAGIRCDIDGGEVRIRVIHALQQVIHAGQGPEFHRVL